jgi:hypothetical protein
MTESFTTRARPGGQAGPMSISLSAADLDAATDFMATHARLLDRRRLALRLGGGDTGPLLAALAAYGNPDGGYGYGLEPDLRSATSQPGGALHALEVFDDVGPATSPRAGALCDWLGSAALPDGGLPFAGPVPDPAGCAPFWLDADAGASSLQITAIVTAVAHRVARHDPAVAGHPWLAAATRYCLEAIRALDGRAPHAIELAFAAQFLDAVHETHPEAAELVGRLAAHVPSDGVVPVAGGSEGEAIRPLDIAPMPGGPARTLFAPDVVAADLARLAALQQPDGGWLVDFASFSPTARLEWRGHATVSAVAVLQANGVGRAGA